ncbi:MAG TPA: hypothetical protein VMV72_04230 [Verrucomicrobiae bacterium]|nr:hypothetical protein [Verrucomicrobiae bacterium]
MRAVSLDLAAALCLTSLAFAGNEAMEKWSENHPDASKALGAWVKANPKAAARFFEWDANHPEKSQAFVMWTIDHPSDEVEKYVQDHHGEPLLDEILKKHRPAAVEFMAWCRNNADAARALMAHPKGLEWAGHHLYKEYWDLESK